MEKTRQVFSTKQPKYAVCASGRAMICLNENKVMTTEQIPVGLNEGEEMEYESREKTVYEYDVYWLDSVESDTDGAVLQAAIAQVIAEITDYDDSPAVNSFYLNGKLTPWKSDDNKTLNKNIRMGLRQNIKDKIALGEESIDMWLGGMKITLPCATADKLMRSLENYAYGCFNVTAAHKKAVSELESIEDVLSYDYKTGYPEKLKMSV